MTLRARLTLGLLTIAVILVVPLVIATRSLGRLHSETKALRDGEFAASLLLGRLRDALNDARGSEMAVLFVKDEQSQRSLADRVTAVSRLADSLDVYHLGGAARDIRAAMSVVASAGEAEYQAARAGHVAAAAALSDSQVVPAIRRAEQSLGAAERTLRQRTRERVVDAADTAQRGSESALVGLALALAIAGLIGVRLARSVHRPVTELERGMRQVADGEFDVQVDIEPDRTDEFGKLAASFHDMTRQLAELDKLKAEFVSVASHELKTPINVILGYTQLLQEEVYGPLTDKQRQVTDVIEAQSRTLARLAKQLLDVTRFEAGAGKLDVRPLHLADLLRQLEQSFQVLADQRGVRFNIVMHEGLPETVYWDSDRINEVLGNLLSNAFKFTERGGDVDLTVVPVDHSVQVEVRDSGAGIPPEQLPRIFEKFFQADNQRAASHAGTGLGLAIARQIVEAHHGTISAESTPGVGTTFTIVLPERAAEARRSSQQTRAVAEVG